MEGAKLADEIAVGETPDELPDEELLYDLADLFQCSYRTWG